MGLGPINVDQMISSPISTDIAPGTQISSVNASNKWDQGSYLSSMISRANAGDEGARQWLADYYKGLAAEERSKQYDEYLAKNQYQWLMQSLRQAGISPYILTGATPPSSNATFSTSSSSSLVSRANNQSTTQTSKENNENTVTANILRAILIGLGTVIAASL